MYVIIWEFLVEPEKADAFVAAYKSTGAWATLFAQAEGYLGTELLSSTESDEEAKFITIDRWKSPRISYDFSSSSATSIEHSTRHSKSSESASANLESL